MNPNVIAPFNWVFPRWISGKRDSVPVNVGIWDADGGLHGDDDHYDVSPVDGKRNLDFVYHLNDSRVTGEVNAGGDAASPAIVHTRGDDAPIRTIGARTPRYGCAWSGSPGGGIPAREPSVVR